MANTSQQVGGAIGTALLDTVAVSATASYIKDHIATAVPGRHQQPVKLQGMAHGYSIAVWFAAGILVAAAAVAVALVNAGRPGGVTVAGGTGVEDEVAVPVVAH